MKPSNKEIIFNAINGSRIEINLLIKEASQIAEASIRLQSRKHRHLFQFISDSYKEIALDSIAELFESVDGTLIKLKKWWERIEGKKRAESEIEIEFRRLVGNQVNDYIFLRYKEKDPSLSKIIRNLKRAISDQMIDGLMLSTKNNLISLETDIPLTKQLQFEVLNVYICNYLQEVSNSSDVLIALRTIFEDHLPEYYFSKVSDVATITRQLFLLRSFEMEDEEDRFITDENLSQFLEQTINEMKTKFYAKYVLKEKLSTEEFMGLFYAVSQIIKSNYSSEHEEHHNFFKITAAIIPDLSKDEYMKKYRNPLEYFVKQTRQHLITEMKKEFLSVLKINGEGK